MKITNKEIKKYLQHNGKDRKITFSKDNKVFANSQFVGYKYEFILEITDRKEMEMKDTIYFFLNPE